MRSTKENILFYVLVPVYNTEKYIRQCLDSVLKQTYQNFQLIVVDDGTPDRAGQICDQYALADERVHVIHKENQGLISARRAAISYVKKNCDENRGYFIFLDSDDSLQKHALQTVADTIEKEACDVVVYGLVRVSDEGVSAPFEKEPYVGTITDKGALYKRVFGSAAYNPLCRKAIKCSLMQDEDYSRYYHISNGEDLLQDIPVYANCEKAVFIPDVLYNYTVNPGSITQSITWEKYKINTTVRSLVWQFLSEQAVWTESDWQEYLAFCKKNLRKEAETIASFKITREKKNMLLDQLKEDPYYATLLEKVDAREKLLQMVKDRKYGCVIAIVKVKNLLRKLLRRIR